MRLTFAACGGGAAGDGVLPGAKADPIIIRDCFDEILGCLNRLATNGFDFEPGPWRHQFYGSCLALQTNLSRIFAGFVLFSLSCKVVQPKNAALFAVPHFLQDEVEDAKKENNRTIPLLFIYSISLCLQHLVVLLPLPHEVQCQKFICGRATACCSSEDWEPRRCSFVGIATHEPFEHEVPL